MKVESEENKVKCKKQIESWLKNYKFYKSIIKADKKYLEQINFINGVNYDGVSISKTNKVNSFTEKEVLERIKREERLKEYSKILWEIDESMKMLSDLENEIISSFYIENLTWDIISYQVHLSRAHCMRKRRQALSKMQLYLF